MFNIFKIAGSALSAQSVRLNTIASNLANAESVAGPNGEPYRARQVVFGAKLLEDGKGYSVEAGPIVESTAPFRLVHEPSNPMADENGYVKMSNVNAVEDMVNMISASRSYQNSTEVISSVKSMMQKTLQIGS